MSQSIILSVALMFIIGTAQVVWAQQQSGQLVGVGILLEPQNDGTVLIRSVSPSGPADKAGIKAEDELLSIDGKSVADIVPQQLVNIIRGGVGTDVTLTVRTKGQRPRQVKVTRADISSMVPAAPGNAANPATPAAPANPPASAAPQTNAPRNVTAPQGSLKFTRIGVKDPGINNIEAVSFLIPAGWKTEGGVQWFPDYSILANLLMKVTDPQTGAQIEFLPAQNFTWLNQMVVPMQPGTNYMGNILWQPIGDIPTFIKTFYAPQATPQLQNARQVAVEDLPKIANEVTKTLGGMGSAKSARVRYEYQRNGQPWEEDVFVTLTYYPWQLGTIWSVNSAYAFRAPKGQLDTIKPVMTTTISTIRLSQEWYGGYMYVQKLFNDRMNQSIRNARAISDTITRNSEEIRQMFADSYKQRSESQDRISQNFSEYIRGVETYNDPYGGHPVQLPSGYNDAWVNARGEYLLSNQAGFDPNVGDTTEWRRMPVTQH
jgi:hypothetical protein